MNGQISESERSQNRTDLGAEHLYEHITVIIDFHGSGLRYVTEFNFILFLFYAEG